MKILSNKTYNRMLDVISRQNKAIIMKEKQISMLIHEINKIKEHNSHVDLIYPNTDERGLTGEAETPINFSDIIEL